MRWQNRRRSSNVSDRRGMGGKTVAGGGLTFIAIGIVVALLGGDPSSFLSEGISRTIQSASVEEKIPEDQQNELAEFVSVVLAETEDTWSKKFAENNADYPEPTLVLFSGGVSSACGRATAAVGPFYCPTDQSLYIDLNFFYDLKNRHDAPGDFAQAYVIAHEVGHHVQNVFGILDQTNAAKRRSTEKEANKISVRTELMADCLAGVWANDTGAKGLLDEGDIEEALKAASQIGDDRLQKQGRGYVVPDSFTHGSSDQRYAWFKRGFDSGDIDTCDTFKSAI